MDLCAILDVLSDNINNSNSIFDTLEMILVTYNFDDIKETEIITIINQCHFLFSSPVLKDRSSVIALLFEVVKDKNMDFIIENKIDLLIAEAISRVIQTKNTPQIDSEKTEAIKFVKWFLKTQYTIPKPIIIALLHLKTQLGYAKLVDALLCEIILNTDSADNIPDVYYSIIKSITEYESTELISFLIYSMEKQNPYFTGENVTRALLSKFSKVLEPVRSMATEKALIKLLSTWSGLIVFGIMNHGIDDLVNVLTFYSPNAYALLSSILSRHLQTPEITFGFAGLTIRSFLEAGVVKFMESLNNINEKDDLLPKLKTAKTALIEVPVNPPRATQTIIENIDMTNIVSSILTQEYTHWDWLALNCYLSFVLPYSGDLENNNLKTFFTRLMDFYSGQFTRSSASKVIQTENVLFAMVRALLALKGGAWLLEAHGGLCEAIGKALKNICGTAKVDSPNSTWSLIESLFILLTSQEGAAVVAHSGHLDILLTLASSVKNPSNFEHMVSKIRFGNAQKVVYAIYTKLLLSESVDLAEIAANHLSSSIQSLTNDEFSEVFNELIIPYVVTVCNLRRVEHSKIGIGLIKRSLERDQGCLAFNGKAEALHKAVHEMHRSDYPLILTQESIDLLDIDAEIDWWLGEHAAEYLEEFMNVFDACIKGKPQKQPLHLFTALGSIPAALPFLEKAVDVILERIPALRTKDKIAHIIALGCFGMSPLSITIIDDHMVIKKLIEATLPTERATVLGAVMTALSMFKHTPKTAEQLSSCGFNIFEFGHIRAALPNVVSAFYRKYEPSKSTSEVLTDVPGKETECKLIRDLCCAVHGPQAFETLLNGDGDMFTDEKLKEFALKVMFYLKMPYNCRLLLYKFMQGCSLVKCPVLSLSEERRKAAEIEISKIANKNVR